MRSAAIVAVCLVVSACSRSDREPSTDMVNSAAAPEDSLGRILANYEAKRLTPDAAAKAILDYVHRTQAPINVELDAPLREAMLREAAARQRSER